MSRALQIGRSVVANERRWKALQAAVGAVADGWPGNGTLKALEQRVGVQTPAVVTEPHREPEWLERAREYVGLREIAGPRHEEQILRWWEAIKAPFRDDETPWCAGFVGGILEDCGMRSSRSAAARSYMSWGMDAGQPRQGAVVVFWRGKRSGWSGHVGFVVGVSDAGDPWVLGGNQGDAVSVRKFSKARVLGYRWPLAGPPMSDYPAARVNGAGEYSNNEA